MDWWMWMDNYILLFDYKDSKVTNNYDPNQCNWLYDYIGNILAEICNHAEFTCLVDQDWKFVVIS